MGYYPEREETTVARKKSPKNDITVEDKIKQLKELLKYARSLVKLGTGEPCPAGSGRTYHPAHLYACCASTQFQGNKIIYGVQCNYAETRGFYMQGEIPIPKYLRDFI